MNCKFKEMNYRNLLSSKLMKIMTSICLFYSFKQSTVTPTQALGGIQQVVLFALVPFWQTLCRAQQAVEKNTTEN